MKTSLVSVDLSNFYLSDGSMLTNVKGNSVVLFFKKNEACLNYINEFHKCSQTFNGLTFCLFDLNKNTGGRSNSEIINNCHSTTTQIKSIPTIIFYNSSEPILVFTNNKPPESIYSFCKTGLEQSQQEEEVDYTETEMFPPRAGVSQAAYGKKGFASYADVPSSQYVYSDPYSAQSTGQVFKPVHYPQDDQMDAFSVVMKSVKNTSLLEPPSQSGIIAHNKPFKILTQTK